MQGVIEGRNLNLIRSLKMISRTAVWPRQVKKRRSRLSGTTRKFVHLLLLLSCLLEQFCIVLHIIFGDALEFEKIKYFGRIEDHET